MDRRNERIRHCRALYGQVRASRSEAALTALYRAWLGVDAFADDPHMTAKIARRVLLDTVRRESELLEVPWPLVLAPGPRDENDRFDVLVAASHPQIFARIDTRAGPTAID